MTPLVQKHILVGVTGGIAAYKAAELVRGLRAAGAEVRVVMTEAARAFITPLTLQALSGHPVRTALMDPAAEAGMGHIELARWADAVLVAPASADFMARLAAGMADDLLATLCLATEAPIALAPAMNRVMWQAKATRCNAETLTSRGVHLFGPEAGEQACGESGPGRMVSPERLVELTASLFGPTPLAGLTVTVTAGPTREPLDPVRFISNRSSGKMGFAVAAAAARAGARVRLVSGPVALPTPAGVERVDVESAEEMLRAVIGEPCDIFIGAAAVADYRPTQIAAQKIKKAAERTSLEMARNPDVLASVAARPEPPFTVGFAAETEALEANARAKLEAKGLDMIAANRVGEQAPGGFDRDVNALHLFWQGGGRELDLAPKERLAGVLIAEVAARYRAKRG
jgi:phosphopantothenoylcysteine decarboxylase/phosphopantothenate--cysteine ligase